MGISDGRGQPPRSPLLRAGRNALAMTADCVHALLLAVLRAGRPSAWPVRRPSASRRPGTGRRPHPRPRPGHRRAWTGDRGDGPARPAKSGGRRVGRPDGDPAGSHGAGSAGSRSTPPRTFPPGWPTGPRDWATASRRTAADPAESPDPADDAREAVSGPLRPLSADPAVVSTTARQAAPGAIQAPPAGRQGDGGITTGHRGIRRRRESSCIRRQRGCGSTGGVGRHPRRSPGSVDVDNLHDWTRRGIWAISLTTVCGQTSVIGMYTLLGPAPDKIL